MLKKFRVCTIGCGSMAHKVHGPSHAKYLSLYPKQVELAACCDIDDLKASEYAVKFGYTRYYTDIEMMLTQEKPDVVCLIVPEHYTAHLASLVLNAGYPLIMEKPPGLDYKEALSVLDSAERSNVPNRVAFNRRYMPLMRRLKSELENHAESGIQNITYYFYRTGRRESNFYTTAIHGIDAVRYLAQSDYMNIHFNYQCIEGEDSVIVNIFLDCLMKSGTTAQLHFCPMSGAIIERATVHQKGHLYFLHLPVWGALDSPGRLQHLANGEIITDLTGNEISDGGNMFESNGFYYENASFFDALREGKRPSGSIETAMQSVEIADCIKKRESNYFAPCIEA